MNERTEKVSVSIPSDILDPARRHAKGEGWSFSGLVADCLRRRLEALGVLGDHDTDAEDLAVCRELRSLGRDPQELLAGELRRVAHTPASA